MEDDKKHDTCDTPSGAYNFQITALGKHNTAQRVSQSTSSPHTHSQHRHKWSDVDESADYRSATPTAQVHVT